MNGEVRKLMDKFVDELVSFVERSNKEAVDQHRKETLVALEKVFAPPKAVAKPMKIVVHPRNVVSAQWPFGREVLGKHLAKPTRKPKKTKKLPLVAKQAKKPVASPGKKPAMDTQEIEKMLAGLLRRKNHRRSR